MCLPEYSEHAPEATKNRHFYHIGFFTFYRNLTSLYSNSRSVVLPAPTQEYIFVALLFWIVTPIRTLKSYECVYSDYTFFMS